MQSCREKVGVSQQPQAVRFYMQTCQIFQGAWFLKGVWPRALCSLEGKRDDAVDQQQTTPATGDLASPRATTWGCQQSPAAQPSTMLTNEGFCVLRFLKRRKTIKDEEVKMPQEAHHSVLKTSLLLLTHRSCKADLPALCSPDTPLGKATMENMGSIDPNHGGVF